MMTRLETIIYTLVITGGVLLILFSAFTTGRYYQIHVINQKEITNGQK